MTSHPAELSGAVEQWMVHFGRSVEMFTGKATTVGPMRQCPAPPDGSNIWKGQVLDCADSRFPLWVGSSPATLAALRGEAGAEAGEMFSEIVSQANQGFANPLGNSLGTPFACSDLEDGTPSGGFDVQFVEVHLLVAGADLPFIAGMSTRLTTVLNGLSQRNSDGVSGALSTVSRPRGAMLERLMDLELPLSVALGRATIPIRDVLRLTSGSLIELNRNVGDPVELLVHGTVVAKGEVVAVRGNYGIRVREIISREDRMALQPRL
jgi:flagellar motor switch protein FliN/FliY